MTDLSGIEKLNTSSQEADIRVENTLPSSETLAPKQEGVSSVAEQEVSKEVDTPQETNETPIKNSLKPSTGYEITQTPNDEDRIALLLSKMMCEKISISQD